jgi:hypothetical protein
MLRLEGGQGDGAQFNIKVRLNPFLDCKGDSSHSCVMLRLEGGQGDGAQINIKVRRNPVNSILIKKQMQNNNPSISRLVAYPLFVTTK